MCLLACLPACLRGDEILLAGAAAAIRWGGGGRGRSGRGGLLDDTEIMQKSLNGSSGCGRIQNVLLADKKGKKG